MSDPLNSPQFKAAIDSIASESGTRVSKLMVEAREDLKEMQVQEGRFTVPAWDLFTRWMARAYQVDFRAEEVAELKRLNAQTALIFLPNHRSYLDPLVLRSVLQQGGFPNNNVLGGANLAMWPMSAIGQRNGIVFIRREFRDDHVYRAVLKAYLAHLIRERQNLEWYIEGGRTRTGKLRPPRLGVLSYVMDAFADYPEHDVQIIPTAIIYDQQHEVSAISVEEQGGRKKPESLKWLYNFATAQSRKLGQAYVRFGEPLSMRDAVSLTADADGELRPRLAVPKLAFEVANRINAVTPITPNALITYALLDNGDRAITEAEGRAILTPLLEYIHQRNLPLTENIDFSRHGPMRDTLHRLVTEGVVTRYDGGSERVFYVELKKQHEAAFYRNTIIHFFVPRAITEIAALQAATEGADDIAKATWEHARSLKDILKFEFFFRSTAEFAAEIAAETSLLKPHWEQTEYDAASALAELRSLNLILAHRVVGPVLEAYWVLADVLATKGSDPVDVKELEEQCLGEAQQRWLQARLPTAESISRDYFRNCIQLAKNRDLIEEGPNLEQRRADFAAQLGGIASTLDELRRIAAETGQPILTERSQDLTGAP